MSELRNDSEQITEGRTPTKIESASLRDQINEKLFKKLEEMEIGSKVVSIWLRGSYNRQRWLERQKAYLSTWDEFLVGSTEGAFQGSSNLHIPMVFTMVKTFHSRFLQAIWADPCFNVKARNEASLERVPVVSDVMRYYLNDGSNNHKGVEKVVDSWVWRWVTQGSGIIKMSWDIKYSKFVDVAEVPVPGKPQIKIINGVEQVVATTKIVEKEVEVVNKTFDGPVWKPVNTEDILIVGGSGDVDEAEMVIESDWLIASDMWTLADRKIFKEKAVKAVIESGSNKQSGAIGSELKVQRSHDAGKSSIDFEEDQDKYQILEAYIPVDIDGSGVNTEVVVWVHLKSKALLRATYLNRISPKGQRPYAKADFIIRDGQEYGIGLPEILYPLAQELDAQHNMRIDFGLISTMPFGFYRPSSGIDPTTIQYTPGALIPVDNPQTDVHFPNLGNRTSFGMQEENAIMNMVERLTSISDLNLGIMSGSQGATRTATGSSALISEMSSNMDVYLKRLNRAWKKALRYTFHMVQKRIPAGLAFRLTGDDGKDYFRTVKTSKDIEGDYDIEVNPNTATSNPQIQQANTDKVLQMVTNPLMLQTGIVNVGNLYEAAKASLQALGIKDWAKYIAKPQGYEYIRSPQLEADEILRGMEVPVTPQNADNGFIQYFEHIRDTDELMGQLDMHQIGLLAIQAKKHEQILQAMQTQAAQAANIRQQETNSQMAAPVAGAAPTSAAPEQGPMSISGAGGTG